MQRILIVGASGNMGRRYTAILRHIRIESVLIDDPMLGRAGYIGNDVLVEQAGLADGVIIATPTPTHLPLLELLVTNIKKPILCEKPISTDPDKVADFCARHPTALVQMVSQYDFLVPRNMLWDHTKYDYWHSGKDGLVWDCINIIYHATGKIELDDKSPYWVCMVNGKRLNIKNMDPAYVEMIRDWVSNKSKSPGIQRIATAHEKVRDYLAQQHKKSKTGSYRRPS